MQRSAVVKITVSTTTIRETISARARYSVPHSRSPEVSAACTVRRCSFSPLRFRMGSYSPYDRAITISSTPNHATKTSRNGDAVCSR